MGIYNEKQIAILLSKIEELQRELGQPAPSLSSVSSSFNKAVYMQQALHNLALRRRALENAIMTLRRQVALLRAEADAPVPALAA